MRVLKVWDGEYPWDVRAEKVSAGLTAGGYEVHMVARNRDRREGFEILDECIVHRMRPWSMLGSRLDAASQFPAFCNPRWLAMVWRVARTQKVSAILVRDLPLAPTAIFVARQLGVPVILDMAENYPAMMRDLWTTGSTRFGDSLIRNPRAVEVIEKWVVARVQHIFVVVEESRDRLIKTLGVPSTKVTVVGNTPSLHRLVQFPVADDVRRDELTTPHRLNLVYLGLLENARGVGAAIEAVALCRDRGVPVRFTIIGDGRAREDFRKLGESLALTPDELDMKGFLPYAVALQIVASADAGIIPHLPNESWNTTIPNKLFDYMAAGLAVLTSDAEPARRIVSETGCGDWFKGGDADSIADTLHNLWKSKSSGEKGRLGREAIQTRFNWEQDQERLLDTFARVVATCPP